MIDGVNLITTETICVSGNFSSNLFFAIFTAMASIVAIVLIIASVKEKLWPFVLICLGCMIALGGFSFTFFNFAFNPKYEEHYLVQLDDKISSEFVDKYEIIERKNNNVYVIKERK